MREDDLRPIWRPGRLLIFLMRRQLHQVRSRFGKNRVELREGAVGEGTEGLKMICLLSGDQSGWLSAILVGSGV